MNDVNGLAKGYIDGYVSYNVDGVPDEVEFALGEAGGGAGE